MTDERLEEIRRRCDWWCDQIQKADDEAIDRGEAHGNYGETWAEAVSYCGSLLTHVYNLRTKLSCKTFCCDAHQEDAMNTELNLEEIEARCEKATEGPWRGCQARAEGCVCGLVWSIPKDVPLLTVRDKDHDQEFADLGFETQQANSRFIAHARTDVPALIAEVRRLREENEELENRCTLITTMMKCATCDRGVKAMYAVCGMCPECARKEIEALRDWQKRAAPWLHELTSSLPEDEQLEVLALLETLDGD